MNIEKRIEQIGYNQTIIEIIKMGESSKEEISLLYKKIRSIEKEVEYFYTNIDCVFEHLKKNKPDIAGKIKIPGRNSSELKILHEGILYRVTQDGCYGIDNIGCRIRIGKEALNDI